MKKLSAFLMLTMFLLLFCECGKAQVDDDEAQFEYREIYLPESCGKAAKPMGLNSVDTDWGIWGHHLGVVLPEKPSITVYALVNGTYRREQLCFSSDRLFDYIVDYVSDNFDDSDTHRFAILPNDNNLVCQCEQCLKAGNTAESTSPAVFNMLKRLAERFPNHVFFTSYYRTTKDLPTQLLPQNTGVLVSAMTYYLCPVETSNDAEFETLLKQWSEKVSHVYVWDYINNFDDYFTPFPVLQIMQRRLQLYARSGVKGVFMNGSGTDYSTLSRLKAAVLTDLLRNPEQDWRQSLHQHCHELYPTAGGLIERFVLLQEDFAVKVGHILPIYDGVNLAVKYYLPAPEFVAFHDSLTALVVKSSGQERHDVEQMCKAMAMTRLELMRLRGDVDEAQPLLNQLKSGTASGLQVYSESCWTVDSYVKEYEEMCREAARSRQSNLLLGKEIVALSALDEDYQDVSILTDGLVGIPSNYHCGHIITSPERELRLAVPHVAGLKQLRLSFASNGIFHIALPQYVVLGTSEHELLRKIPMAVPGNPGRGTVTLDIPKGVKGGTLVLSIVRNTEERAMAIDEIEGF